MPDKIKILAELKGDRVIWMIFILLVLASFLTVYSAMGIMEYRYSDVRLDVQLMKHALILFVGIALVFVFHRMDYRDFEKVTVLLFYLSIALLLFTMFFGVEINDARRWINIPFVGLSLQTSDIAKISLVMYISRLLAFKQAEIKSFKSGFLKVVLPILLICALIAPSNLSTALLLFMVCIVLVYIGRVRTTHIALLGLSGVGLIALIFLLGEVFPDDIRVDTWWNRIESFVSEEGSHDNLHAKIAIANGGWMGLGPGNSVERNFIAYPYADFIYAIIVEEYGLIGGFFVLLAYAILLLRVVVLVTKSKKAFASFLMLGLCLLISLQAFINMAVSLQLIPTTGQTMPLLSLGGTSIIFTCIAFGMILCISHHIKMDRLKASGSSEIDIANA